MNYRTQLQTSARTTMMSDNGPDLQSLLAMPSDSIKPPVNLPVGGYVGRAIQREFDKAKNEKQTPIVRYTIQFDEPLPDVDETELAAALEVKSLAENTQRLEFWLTPEAVYRLKEWAENHCKVDTSGMNLAEIIEAALGQPFVSMLGQQPNKKNPERPYINIVSTAAVPD